jgi:uncharacterized OsmC-like protein
MPAESKEDMSKSTNAAAAAATSTNIVNGVDLDALQQIVAAIAEDPSRALLKFRVASKWQGQLRSEATISGYDRAGEWIERKFKIQSDEPAELLGTNTAPNPQELLMAALNACMMVGYTAGAALRGITLSRLEIETTGELDTRGFLGNPDVPAGFRAIDVKVTIGGNGSEADFHEIHETVLKTSPNVFNLTRPVAINGELRVAK